MYPSPRRLYPPPTESGVVAPSPKKKPRPNVLRQLYALPAIHQFEPVRTSHASSSLPSPRIGMNKSTREDEAKVLPLATVAPLSPPLSFGDRKISPRFRPQPPPPLATSPVAATASRIDQDLLRYSQGVKQRMSIRPLFEQRREEEADIARRILVSRETDPGTSRQGPRAGLKQDGDDDDHERQPTPPLRTISPSSRRATTPVTTNEIALLEPRGITTRRKTPRMKRERLRTQVESDCEGSQSNEPATEEAHGRTDQDDEIALGSVRFRTPTPPSSAGPSQSHVEEVRNGTSDASTDEAIFSSTCSEQVMGLEDGPISSSLDNTSHELRSSALSREGSLVSSLSDSTLHRPFQEKRGAKMSWLTRKPLTNGALDVKSKELALPPRTVPSTVCYKLLWKETKTLSSRDSQAITIEMRVLLSSNGKAHISIYQIDASSPTNKEEQKLVISESDLLMSAKTRPDLAVMTPKWARWLLSRVQKDENGVWFLRIKDIFAMEASCVFSGDVTISGGSCSFQSESTVDDHVVSVSIYLVGAEDTDSEALLVHARDTSVAPPSLTEIVLQRHELTAIATLLGYLPSHDDTNDSPALGDQVHTLLRNSEFLQRAVATSKAVRLALRSVLHVAEAAESASDLPFRTGSRAATTATADGEGSSLGLTNESSNDQTVSHTVAEYEAQGLTYGTSEIKAVVRANAQLAEVAFLSQAYYEDAAEAALRWLQRQQAVDSYVENYVKGDGVDSFEMSEAVRKRIETAKRAKLEDIAVRLIVDDLIGDFIALECRFELHHAKYSGGFDDYYASKVQSVYRMSYQRRDYVAKRNTRLRAVRLIQALQRGIIARRRYCEMRVEREKYLFYGFRSSLHHATASIEDPHHRAMDISRETERRRQTFLMQVLHGYVVEHGLPTPFRISPELVQSIINEYSVVVGCSPTLGDTVAAILITSRHSQPLPKKTEAKAPPPRLFGSSDIHAALLTALRMQYDDTYGLSSSIRKIAASEKSPTKAQMVVTAKRSSSATPATDENMPPRWLLKCSPPFQRSNRNRIASLRLTRKIAGQRAAHLVVLDYRNLLLTSFQTFDKCRATWEDSIRSRKQQILLFDRFSVDDLVQHALEKLTAAVKDWGLDPEPLFEALNLCLLHRLGKAAITLTEQAFNRFALGVNELHGKRNVYPLRDEIAQELEEFEALLAVRCLNIANDSVVTIPPSELLHVLLVGKVDDEYLRHGLPSVLPIASVNEKMQLADKMIRNYANVSYGEAFNSICWSCLDTAESVTVEAAQFLERITRPPSDDGDYVSLKVSGDTDQSDTNVSIAARALYLLTGSQALRFLQFLAKVAHFTRPLQRRVLDLLAPHAHDLEMYRLASVVCSIDSFEVVTRLFDENFNASVVHNATRFWVQYGILYGEDCAETARASCALSDVSQEKKHPHETMDESPVILPEPISA